LLPSRRYQSSTINQEAKRKKTTMEDKRTNAELTSLIEAHIKSILSDNSKSDYASTWDLSKPTPQLAATIDHTLLKPTATKQQIEVLCEEAKEHGFAVCT